MGKLPRLTWLLQVLCLLVLAPSASADADAPDYYNLAEFRCADVTRSRFIERLCYDATQRYMFIKMTGKSYHYCGIDPELFEKFTEAPSLGKFYNAHIKGRKEARPFDCRLHGTQL